MIPTGGSLGDRDTGEAARTEEGQTMTDFVIVIATAAMLGTSAVPGAIAPAAPAPGATASSIPATAPTVGFRTYPDAASCEQATAGLVAPAGARLVCIPVEPLAGELTSAY